MQEDPHNLILIESFNDAIQAHLMAGALEEEGIEVFIMDENLVSINPLFSNVVGGVKLKVKQEDADKALQLIQQMKQTPYTNDDGAVIKCPWCESEKVDNNFRSIKSFSSLVAFFLALFTTTYPLRSDHRYYCLNCKKQFEHKPQ